jgi:hypothetical protein
MEGFGGPATRLAAFGEELIEVHDWLRMELARLGDDVNDYLVGGPRPRDLPAHCLAFCAALERHHTGEDDGAFPALAERHPELAPVLEKLREDHRLVSDILGRLRGLAGGVDLRAGADPQQVRRVRGELDGLKAILESHFGYEERSIVEALNTLNAREWSNEPPAFLRTDPVD